MNGASENMKDGSTKENALDKYINGLYETELKFQIEESEVWYIQNCVETLVKSLVVKSKSSQVYRKYVEQAVEVSTRTETEVLKFIKEQSLNDNENVLSVGSFYEGTRNTFPYEFDYIVVLTELPENLWWNQGCKLLLYGFYNALNHVVNENTNDFKHQDLQLRGMIRTSGPASKLEFIYKNQHLIHVDLAPAVRLEIDKIIIDKSLNRSLIDEQWHQRVLKTGTYLKMLFHKRGQVMSSIGLIHNSIVETELTFMTTEVSFNHKLAYRFLKYILSRQNEEMQDLLFRQKTGSNWKKCDFPSYLVKTLLYQHVKKCSSDSSVGACCLGMLLCLHSRFLTAEDGSVIYLESVLGSRITICKDKVLAKQLEQVINSYVLRLQEFRTGHYNTKRKLDLNPVTQSATDYIKQHIKPGFCRSHCFRVFLRVGLLIQFLWICMSIVLLEVILSVILLYSITGTVLLYIMRVNKV